MMLILLLICIFQIATAFSPATTRRQAQHQLEIQLAPQLEIQPPSISRLNLFGRSAGSGNEDDDGNDNKEEIYYTQTIDRYDHSDDSSLLDVKKIDSFPARAKQLRNKSKMDSSDPRHAWKKKNREEIKYHTRLTYVWRGVIQKVRYAIRRSTVYVLELEHNKYYVGSTRNRNQRYREHFEQGRNRSRGSKWTRLHKPLRIKAEYKRIPSRYLMGVESQVTSEMMVRYGVNNVRGAGFCRVREFTSEDVHVLTSFLGHYNQLDYDSLHEKLLEILPPVVPSSPRYDKTTPNSNKSKSRKKKKRRGTISQHNNLDPNVTKLTDKDVSNMTSFNRKRSGDKKPKRRNEEQKISKEKDDGWSNRWESDSSAVSTHNRAKGN